MAVLSRNPAPKDMLRPFLLFSAGVHTLLFVFFFAFSPLLSPKPKPRVINFTLLADAPAVESPNPAPAAESPLPQPAAPKVREIRPKSAPLRPAQTAPKPAPPVSAQAKMPAPVQEQVVPRAASQSLPPLQAPQAAVPAPQPAAAPPIRIAAVKSPDQEDNDALAGQVDQLLLRTPAAPAASSDYLAGGMWTGAPRKTLAFPNIKARIAELENRGGFGYSVTARITFTSQGWVSMVELTQASGDPRIDNIFRNELRKIRIEESPSGSSAAVMKSFVISVQ